MIITTSSGAVVQLGERLTGSQEVGSSSLLSSTMIPPCFPCKISIFPYVSKFEAFVCIAIVSAEIISFCPAKS